MSTRNVSPAKVIVKQPVASITPSSPPMPTSPITTQSINQAVDTGDFGAGGDSDITLSEADLLNAELSLGFEDTPSTPTPPTTGGTVQNTAPQSDVAEVPKTQSTTTSTQALESELSVQDDSDQTLTDGDVNTADDSLFADDQGNVTDTSDIDPTLTDNDVDTTETDVDTAITEENPDEALQEESESTEQQPTESVVTPSSQSAASVSQSAISLPVQIPLKNQSSQAQSKQ